MLFNFQSPVSFVHSLEVNSFIISRGFEFVKHFFWKSFKFFVLLSATKKHSIFSLPWGLLTSCDVLSRWQLIYNIMPKLFCQHLFSKKLHFFEKRGKFLFFHLSMRVYNPHFLQPPDISRYRGIFYIFSSFIDSLLHTDRGSDILPVQILWL